MRSCSEAGCASRAMRATAVATNASPSPARPPACMCRANPKMLAAWWRMRPATPTAHRIALAGRQQCRPGVQAQRSAACGARRRCGGVAAPVPPGRPHLCSIVFLLPRPSLPAIPRPTLLPSPTHQVHVACAIAPPCPRLLVRAGELAVSHPCNRPTAACKAGRGKGPG